MRSIQCFQSPNGSVLKTMPKYTLLLTTVMGEVMEDDKRAEQGTLFDACIAAVQ